MNIIEDCYWYKQFSRLLSKFEDAKKVEDKETTKLALAFFIRDLTESDQWFIKFIGERNGQPK